MELIKRVAKISTIRKNPIGSIVDKIITLIVNLLSPFPIPSAIISQLKMPVIGFFASLVILTFFATLLVGALVLSPFIITLGYLRGITADFQSNTIEPDKSFVQTSVPKQNPFGGNGMDFTNVTAYYLDPDYYIRFGKNHTGIDLVPSNSYYKNSNTYHDSHKVVAFATMNGTAKHFVDQYGGETIEITNSDNSIKALYIHFSQVFIESGSITAGTPIGIMGKTGDATGEHVHYEIRIKDGDTWRTVNPLNYIEH